MTRSSVMIQFETAGRWWGKCWRLAAGSAVSPSPCARTWTTQSAITSVNAPSEPHVCLQNSAGWLCECSVWTPCMSPEQCWMAVWTPCMSPEQWMLRLNPMYVSRTVNAPSEPHVCLQNSAGWLHWRMPSDYTINKIAGWHLVFIPGIHPWYSSLVFIPGIHPWYSTIHSYLNGLVPELT